MTMGRFFMDSENEVNVDVSSLSTQDKDFDISDNANCVHSSKEDMAPAKNMESFSCQEVADVLGRYREHSKNDSAVDGITYKTGEVAAFLGISSQLVRNYSEIFSDFLNISTAGSNQRLYKKTDIDMLRYILELRRAKGFSVNQTREYLSCADVTTTTTTTTLSEANAENSAFLAGDADVFFDLLSKGVGEIVESGVERLLQQSDGAYCKIESRFCELLNELRDERNNYKKENDELRELLSASIQKNEELSASLIEKISNISDTGEKHHSGIGRKFLSSFFHK